MEHGYGGPDPTHALSRSYAFKPIAWSVQIREPRSDSWRFAGVQNLNEVALDLIGHPHRENPGHGFFSDWHIERLQLLSSGRSHSGESGCDTRRSDQMGSRHTGRRP